MNASPQNPARPGSPSDASDANPSSPASAGAAVRSPPSSSSLPVRARSFTAPTRKNSSGVMSPWARFANSAALTPASVPVANASTTNPMWPTEE